MNLPLAGLRVLTFENFGAGPYGSMFLADLGAGLMTMLKRFVAFGSMPLVAMIIPGNVAAVVSGLRTQIDKAQVTPAQNLLQP